MALLARLVLKDETDNQVFREKMVLTVSLDLQEMKANPAKRDQLVRLVHLDHQELVFQAEMVSTVLQGSLVSLVYQDHLVNQQLDYQVLTELQESLAHKVQQESQV